MLLVATAAMAAPPSTIQFEGFIFPDNVLVDSNRSLTLCLVNQGDENELIRDGVDDDHLTLTIPMGPASSDLEADGTSIGCTPGSVEWNCTVDVKAKKVVLTLGPFSDSVTVSDSSAVCFHVTAVQVNSAEGLSSWEIRLLRQRDWNLVAIQRLPRLVFLRAQWTMMPLGVRLPRALRRDLWERFRQPEVRAYISRMCSGYQGALPSLPQSYAAIRCPTFILWGERDRHFHPSRPVVCTSS